MEGAKRGNSETNLNNHNFFLQLFFFVKPDRPCFEWIKHP